MNKKKEIREKNSSSKKKNIAVSKPDQQFYWTWILIILILTFISYTQVLGNSFTNWDDNSYIQNNILIRSVNLKEIFSNNLMGNYHPLTILIYAIEYRLFNLNESGYYIVNLFIHLLNTFLVSKVILRLSNKTIVALVAALFFGIHPIHVESVAWASELKDLLYTFFFLCSYIYYLKYINDSKRKYYLLALLMFLLSLLSKAMAASLPFILLLTDYFKARKINGKTLVEKIPFLILSIIFGLVAISAQRSFGSTESTVFPIPYRIVFASYSFLTYLIKLFLPVDLCSYYPYPIRPGESVPSLYLIYLAVLILLMTSLFYFARSYKKIFFGIAFFSITVFLVLQLIPVGDNIMADRYCYIPSIGIFYLAGEFFYWLWEYKYKTFTKILLIVFALFFSIQTYARCTVWKNSMSLWNDVIMQYKNAAIAFSNRGFIEMNENKLQEALDDFNKAIEIKPDYAFAYNNRAVVLKNMKNSEEIILRDLNKAIELNPKYVDALNNRGIVFTTQKKYEEAISDFNKSIEIQPKYGDLYYNRGVAEFNFGKANEACQDFQIASGFGNQKARELFNSYCH